MERETLNSSARSHATESGPELVMCGELLLMESSVSFFLADGIRRGFVRIEEEGADAWNCQEFLTIFSSERILYIKLEDA